MRSSTIKVLAVTPPLASNNPPIVEIPDTFSDANVPKPAVGEILQVIPNHVCVAVNMVDQLVGIRGDEICEVIPVAARGMLV